MVPCVYGVKDQPLDGEFCVFDTETTGLDPGVEYLTEIGAVIIRNGEVVEEFDTFVKPGKPITPKITELTGITNEMVADAPSEKEALEAFLAFAGDRILVGHNVHAFDMRFLRAAAKRSGIKLEPTYIDTLTMAQTMYRACTIISRAPSISIWNCPPTRRTAPARTPLHWDASSA